MARRLCLDERARIEAMAGAGFGAGEMAQQLGRHRSTVQRELARGGGPQRYRAVGAQQSADTGAARPKAPKLACDPVLGAAVAERLGQRWSPHAISADLRARGLGVCAETIYRGCYANSAETGLEPRSWSKLPRQRRRRKPRSRCEQAKRSALGEYRPIADRPAKADNRSEPGHWEGDLIIGRKNRSAVATLVERASRHTLVVPLAGGHDAQSTARAVAAALARQPAGMVKTLTWDQGTEMARWADIEKTLDAKVYFCEPRSPWQRPTNEQTNGLLRRWLPKSTDLNIGPVRLAIIEDNLNTMPRKLHHWNTAQTIYNDLCRNHR